MDAKVPEVGSYRWVPIEEKNPPENYPVDVCTDNTDYKLINKRFSDVILRDGKWFIIPLDMEINGVTHWRFPPGPPAAGNVVDAYSGLCNILKSFRRSTDVVPVSTLKVLKEDCDKYLAPEDRIDISGEAI
jgi:hypothetical protein